MGHRRGKKCYFPKLRLGTERKRNKIKKKPPPEIISLPNYIIRESFKSVAFELPHPRNLNFTLNSPGACVFLLFRWITPAKAPASRFQASKKAKFGFFQHLNRMRERGGGRAGKSFRGEGPGGPVSNLYLSNCHIPET